MHPGNVDIIKSAGIQACVLANNHTLDWGIEGLIETLDALHGAGIQTSGKEAVCGRVLRLLLCLRFSRACLSLIPQC